VELEMDFFFLRSFITSGHKLLFISSPCVLKINEILSWDTCEILG
jgi:hypothetical protein